MGHERLVPDVVKVENPVLGKGRANNNYSLLCDTLMECTFIPYVNRHYRTYTQTILTE